MSTVLQEIVRSLPRRVEKVKLSRLKLLEVNARYMKHETFQRLIENVARDGGLTQVPLAIWDGDPATPVDARPELLEDWCVYSGNHRVKAAIEGLGEDHLDFVMFVDGDMTRQQKVALQLSHNAIAGEDDPAILAQLYNELEDVDWRAYSGLDDQVLQLLEDVQIGSLTEPQLDWTAIELVFLPEEAERLEAALREALTLISADSTFLLRWSEYDRLLDALALTGAANDVRNQATAMAALLSVFERHKLDLRDGFLNEEGEPRHSGWVPLEAVLGNDRVPAQLAATLNRAVETMLARGEIEPEKRWRAIELLLSGADEE